MSTPLKILFVIPSLGKRGTERQLFELLRGLTDRDRSNDLYRLHVVTLVAVSPSYTEQVEELGIPVTCLNCSGKFDYVRSILKIGTLIRKLDIDLVHGFLNLGSWVAAIAGKLKGVRVIASSIRDSRDSTGTLKYYRAMTSRLAHVFTSNSKAGFNNRYDRWRDNFQVIYNGIDLSRFESRMAKREHYQKELSIAPDHKCIAMVAALSEHKDYKTFIDAAALLSKKRNDLKFVSVGTGPMSQTIQAYSKDLGSPVQFLGNRNDVDTFWSIVDVSVMLTNTQLIEEGLPNSVMESMACGVPVIANNAGGTVEVIDHEVNGFLLDQPNSQLVADTIERWLDNEQVYAALSKGAFEKISTQFSYEAFIDIHEQLYRNAVIDTV